MKKQIVHIILAMIVCAIAAYFMVQCCAPPSAPQSEVITTDPPIIVPTMPSCCTTTIQTEEITTEATTTIIETEAATTTVEALYYDIPLPEELQIYTIEVCDEYNINPLVIFAMMEVESIYTIDIIGDNGNAVGILQIQPRFHQGRADELNVSIYDVEGNILVAVDLLAELLDKYGDYGLAITAYNRGTASEISEYGKKVLRIASTIEIKN